jgi:hypothetical protein
MSRWSRLAVLVLVTAGACGGAPLLGNVPRPNPAVVAGIAAAAATAATVANPAAAAANVSRERDRPEEKRAVQSTQMPGDVLDRLDAAERAGGE